MAQRHFQKRVLGDFQNNFLLSSHAPSTDNGFWIIGKNAFTAGMGRNYIIKTDSLGDTLFVKQHITDARVGFSSVLTAQDGGVYIVGTFDAPTGAIREYLFVSKLNSSGEVEWSKSYTGEHYTSPVAHISNNTIYIGGVMGGGFSQSGAIRHIYLIRLDENGNVLSSDFRAAEHNEFITDISVTPSGFAVMSGVTYINNSQGNPLMVSADFGGNLRYFNDLNFTSGIPTNGIAEGITVRGNEVWLTGTVYGFQNVGKVFVARINGPLSDDGEFSLFNHSFGMDAYDITGNRGTGELIIGGTIIKDNDGKNQKMLISCESDFSLNWTKGYGNGDGGNQLSKVHIRPNGDITGTGKLSLNHFFGIDILRVDKNGRIGCLEDTYNLSMLPSSQLLVTQYVPDGFAPFVDTLGGGVFFTGVADFSLTKTCNLDSCKANFTFSKDTLCANTCITVTDSSKNATNWNWSFANGSPTTFSGQNPNQVCFATQGLKTIKLVVSNSINSDSIEKTVYVHPPVVANAGVDTTICRGQQIRLQGSGGQVYSWFPTNFKNSSTLPNPRVNPDSTIRYFLTVKDSNNCEDVDSVLISVVQPPTTITLDTTICDDKTIMANAQNTGFSYLWSTGVTNQTTTLDTGKHFVVLSNSCFTDTSYYTIKGKDCKPEFIVPTAFSPNGDGLNDVFTVHKDNIVQVKMTIFNRWGEIIFDEEGRSPSWDGTYKGAACPTDHYIYLIELKDITGKKYNGKGTVTLLR
ncbi:MAG: gliding motility-associated C-terminal domain-containing protein [bacterium]